MPDTFVTRSTAELIRLSHAACQVVNTRDFSFSSPVGQDLLSHVSPSFEARFGDYLHTLTWDQQTEGWIKMCDQDPDFYWDIAWIDVKVSKKEKTASVYMQLDLNGIERLNMKGACELKWRFVQGKWLWWYHTSFRGPT